MARVQPIVVLTHRSYVTIDPEQAGALVETLRELAPGETCAHVYRETARAMEDALVGRRRRRVVLGMMQEFVLLKALEHFRSRAALSPELRRLRADLADDLEFAA